MIEHKTIFSDDRKHRYTLWRDFQTDFLFDGHNRMSDGFVQFIGLNPSTADELQDDPTIRRCIQFSKDWGYGSMCMTNLFAFRATDPSEMMRVLDPIGKDNTFWIQQIEKSASIVVACWGVHGAHLARGYELKRLIESPKLHHLGLTQNGHPKHPLYLKATTKPKLWDNFSSTGR